jgi:hypothetical protein
MFKISPLFFPFRNLFFLLDYRLVSFLEKSLKNVKQSYAFILACLSFRASIAPVSN